MNESHTAAVPTVLTKARTIDTIERLLDRCHDGVEGYGHAAQAVPEGALRAFLLHARAEREEIVAVLTNVLVALGRKPSHHGSLAGAAHRSWLDAVAALGRRPDTILHECQRGEQETLGAFVSVLGRAIPDDVRKTLGTTFQRLLHASAALNRAAADLDAEGKLHEASPSSSAPKPAAKSGTVADIMNPKLLYIRDGDRLTLARAKILEHGVTAVPVLEEDHRPVGVVSLRDLIAGREPQATYPVHVVRASATIPEGARKLAEAEVHHLVVVDDAGVAVGMVSAVDFVRAFTGLPPQHPRAFDAY